MSTVLDLTLSSDDESTGGVTPALLTQRIRSLVRARDCSSFSAAKVQRLLEQEFGEKLGQFKDLIATKFQSALLSRSPAKRKKTTAPKARGRTADGGDAGGDAGAGAGGSGTGAGAGSGAGGGLGSSQPSVASGHGGGSSAPAGRKALKSTVTSAELQLLLPSKKKVGSTLLLQFAGDKFNFRGSGTVGKLSVGQAGMVLDLKGHRYAGTIVPCNTFMLVGVSGTDAKVEAVMNEHVQVSHVRDIVSTLGGVFMKDGELAPLLEFEDVNVETQEPSGHVSSDGGTSSKPKSARKGAPGRKTKRGAGGAAAGRSKKRART